MSGEDVPAVSSSAVVKGTSKTSSSTITPTKSGSGGGNTTPPTEPPTATSGGFDDNNPFSPAAYTPERKANAIYPDTPKQADNILRAKCGEVWQTLSADEKSALYSYTTLNCRNINPALRNGIKTAYPDTIETIRHIDNALEKTSLAQDMYIRRGSDAQDLLKFGFPREKLYKIRTLQLQDMKDMLVGKEGTEPAYWSCGAAKVSGFFDKEIEFKIYCPKGIKGIYTEPFSASGAGGKINWDGVSTQENFGKEQEFLLARGYKMRVVDVEYQDMNAPSKGWRVSVELIGYEPKKI